MVRQAHHEDFTFDLVEGLVRQTYHEVYSASS
jgi:hypothetical protein